MDAATTKRFGLTSRQVNVMLEVLFVSLILSGLASWILSLDQARIATTVHAVSAFMLLGLTPLKIRGPVKVGFVRGRVTRWISAAFGVMLLSGATLGMLHTTKLWWGLGYWQALWTHLLFGFVSIPFFVWHVVTRPARPKLADLDRRSAMTSIGLTAAAVTVVGVQETALRGASRSNAGTGSHELASFDPAALPQKRWLNDTTPRSDLAEWELRIEDELVDIAALAERAASLTAWLDCTDGWRSQQRWDVVPLASVLSAAQGRSVRVTASTGYSRLFARSDANSVYLCFGYDGEPLRRGHGAPVRIVAPNRRGPWWIKWVASIELTDRPAWLQLPLPAS